MSEQQTAARETLQGALFHLASEEEVRAALEQAFDYRGDVTITRHDGSRVAGYIFDRHNASTLAASYVRLVPADRNDKLKVGYAEIAGLEFTGRDMAAGKSWEAWVKKYLEKKAAGETGIEIQPERLD
jgi:hypothetical protein